MHNYLIILFRFIFYSLFYSIYFEAIIILYSKLRIMFFQHFKRKEIKIQLKYDEN